MAVMVSTYKSLFLQSVIDMVEGMPVKAMNIGDIWKYLRPIAVIPRYDIQNVTIFRMSPLPLLRAFRAWTISRHLSGRHRLTRPGC
jgi:hypothetical protein